MFPNAKICITPNRCEQEGKRRGIICVLYHERLRAGGGRPNHHRYGGLSGNDLPFRGRRGRIRPHPGPSKMVSNLREKGLVTAQKYGEIHLTDSGWTFGRYLLYRHELLHQFLCFLNHSQNELEQVEKIEHFVDEKTVRSIQAFLDSLTRDGGT